MSEKFPVPNGEERILKLGDSFMKHSDSRFHSIRYDFKPASVDTTQDGTIDVAKNNAVTVKVPHVPSSGTTHTTYQGQMVPSQKECLLIIDNKTGEICLERLNSNLRMKKTRTEKSKARSVTPVEKKPKTSSGSHKKSPEVKEKAPVAAASTIQSLSDNSDNSSLSDGDLTSDEDSEEEPAKPVPVKSQPKKGEVSPRRQMSTLSDDLKLSDSGSDSD